MPEPLVELTKRIEELSATMNRRFEALSAAMTLGFEQVADGFTEQRRYTDFASERLEKKMDAGFARLDTRANQSDARVARLERKVDQAIDAQLKILAEHERRLSELEHPES